MQELRTSELHKALDAVLELQCIDSLPECPQRVSETRRGTIPCHHAHSSRTVEKHMQAIYEKHGAGNRTEAVSIASRAPPEQ